MIAMVSTLFFLMAGCGALALIVAELIDGKARIIRALRLEPQMPALPRAMARFRTRGYPARRAAAVSLRAAA